MSFLNKLFGGGDLGTKKETVADRIVSVIQERTMMDCLKVIPVKGATTPWNSKIGGVPYMPTDFAYPYDETGGREAVPLRFLVQLNFDEMPCLEGFPTEGILQFYVSDRDTYGLNFDNLTVQKGFRVIYHASVSENDRLLADIPTAVVGDEKVGFPVEEELKLNFEKTCMAMGGGDYRFDKVMLEAYNVVHPDVQVLSLDRISEEIMDEVYEQLDRVGHRVGGYPVFTQLDPREYHEELKGHTVLLFQLNTEKTDDYSIQWGDSGVANFFICPEDLAARDFSGVLYNWDCY